MAFKEGMQRGGPVLQEPMMKVEVVVPEEFWATCWATWPRRGAIEGMEPRGKAQAIRAMVPLAEMFGYATELRSATQGRGVYTMEFDHYAPSPPQAEWRKAILNARTLALGSTRLFKKEIHHGETEI